MFFKENISVKEKRNLIGFNLWSGTDYLNTISQEQTEKTNFSCTQGLNALESSKEWSENYERCMKQNLSQNQYVVFFYNEPDLNCTYTGNMTILAEVPGTVYLLFRDENAGTNTKVITVNFAASELPQKISITIDPTDLQGSETQLQLRLFNKESGIIYSDNWCLIED